MFTQTIEKTQYDSSDSYLLIKDEELAAIVISSQTLAGSRVLLSTYQQVVFSECTFYAVDFQGVTFENCVFENCSFEFSHIKKCQFKNCNFTNCKFVASTSINSSYNNCLLDTTFTTIINSARNWIQSENNKEDFSTDIYIEMLAA